MMRRASLHILLAALLVTAATASPAHAGGFFAPLLGLFSTGGALAGVGTFFTKTFFGRLLGSVIVSALQAKLQQRRQVAPGIRTSVTQTGGVNPMTFVVGRMATAGAKVCPDMSHGTVGRTPNAFLTQVIDLGDVPGINYRRLAIDGAWVELGTTPHADYGLPVLGKYAGHAWLKFRDGTETTADAMLVAKYSGAAERPWTSDMVGTGVPHVIMTYLFETSVFNAMPTTRHEVESTPLYDPRKDSTAGGTGGHRWGDPATYEPTDNPVVILYNIWRGIDLPDIGIWGGSIPASDLRLSVWGPQMDRCDAPIALAAGGTEPRYRAGFEISVADEPFSVADELLLVCNGEVAEVGGEWVVRVGEPGLPVYFFTDADCIVDRPEEMDPFPAFEGTYNAISATRPAPEMVYEPKETPLLTNPVWEAEDQGQQRPVDLTLSACPYAAQAQRVIDAYIKGQRRMRTHKLVLPPAACVLAPGDTVAWTSTRNGYDGKLFEVTEIEDDPVTIQQMISLREVDPQDNDYDPADQLPETYASPTPEPLAPHSVAGWGISGISLTDADGTARRPAAQLVWDGDDQQGVRALDYEIRRIGTTLLVAQGAIGEVSAGELVVAAGILPSTAYEGRAIFRANHATEWTAWTAFSTPATTLTAEDLADGSVTETWQAYAAGPFSVPTGQQVLLTLTLGEITGGNLHMGGFSAEVVNPSSADIDLIIERRRLLPGASAYTAWTTTNTETSPAFSGQNIEGYSFTFAGYYDDVQYRVSSVLAAGSAPGAYVQGVWLTVKRLTEK